MTVLAPRVEAAAAAYCGARGSLASALAHRADGAVVVLARESYRRRPELGVFRITDSVTVLRDGKTVTTQPTKDLTLEKLVSYMVGREMTERFPKGNRKPGEVIFEVENLRAQDPNDASYAVLNAVSFDLRRGEILGIAGLMGSGRTELVTTIFGEYGKIIGGKMRLEGRELSVGSARDAMHQGLSLVPEDRKGQGLVLIQSILKNISLANLDQFASFFRIDADAELRASMDQAKNLAIKAPNLQVACETLSGGNQQKVVIAKWLLSNPCLLYTSPSPRDRTRSRMPSSA